MNKQVIISEPDNETLSRICEAFYSRQKGMQNGVRIDDIYRHDAINYTFSGVAEIGGIEYGFIIDDGNWNGTELREWGLAEDIGGYQPPPPLEPLTFIPSDDSLAWERPHMFGVYLMWRKEAWFAEQERNYAYDRQCQPGRFVENHYRNWAAQKGMKIGLLSDLGKAIEHYRTVKPANMPEPPTYRWDEESAGFVEGEKPIASEGEKR